jgi:hypothetical protein
VGQSSFLTPTAPEPSTTPPRGGSSFLPAEVDPLRTALEQANEASPDRAARILQLRTQTGLSADLIDRNFDELDRKARANTLDVETLRKISPATSAWLTQDPQHAAAAKDDVPRLQQLEHQFNGLTPLLRGIDMLQSTISGAVEWAGETTGVDAIREYGRLARERNQEEAAAYGTRISFETALRSPGDFGNWLYQTVGEQIPQMAPNVAGGVAGAAYGSTFGPAGTAIGGMIGAFAPSLVTGIGETQSTLKDIDPLATAPLSVFIGGTAIAALDSALPGRVGSKLTRAFGQETAEQIARKALTAAVKPRHLVRTATGVVTGMATEGFTEALQEAIGAVTAAGGAGVSVNVDQLKTQMVEAGAAGAVMGGGFGGAAAAGEARAQSRRAVAAEQQSAFFTALGQTVTDSELLKRVPEKAREFIAQATKDGPVQTVYAPTSTFEEYWQSKGINPAIVAEELTGDRDALERAKAEGTDLPIPIAAYATKIAPTEHQAFFARELKLRPDVLNIRENEELEASVAEAAVQPNAVRDRTEQQDVAAEEIARRFAGMAVEQGTPQWQADAWGRYMGARYVARAARKGVDPLALYEEQPREVVRQEASQASTLPREVVDEGVNLGIPRSPTPKGETRQAAILRRQTHVAALASSLVREAQRLDPTVDPAMLRAELEFRIDFDQEQQGLERESGTGQDLLRAIAGYGGMWWDPRSGHYRGEVEGLVESGRDIRAVKAGSGRVVHEPGRATYNGVPGVFREGGRSPDMMREALSQDARFADITGGVNELIDAIDQALRAGQQRDELPGSEDLGRLGIDPATRWWDKSWRAPNVEIDDDAAIDETEPAGGDISFDPNEFEQRETETYAVSSDVPVYPGREESDHVSSVQVVLIDQLEPSEDSSDDEVQAMAAVMREGTALPAIVVNFAGERADGADLLTVVDGHTRLAAAQAMGFQAVPIRVVVSEDDWARVAEAGGLTVARGDKRRADEFEQRIGLDAGPEARLAALPDSTSPNLPAPAKQVPFPRVPDAIAEQLYRASFALFSARPVEQQVPIKDVVSTQEWFFPNVVETYLTAPEEREIADSAKPPLAMRYQGRYYLTDGHHRAVAEWAQGHTAITARVVDVDQAVLERELAPPGGGTTGPIVTTPGARQIGNEPQPFALGSMPAPAAADAGLEARQRIEAAREAARADVDRELGVEPGFGDELHQLTERNTPEGFEVVAPYLEDDEAIKLRRDTAEALLDIWESLPSDADFEESARAGVAKKGWYERSGRADFEESARAGVAKKGWYERSGRAITAIFGPVDGLRFTALLAALSPRTDVDANLLNATRMWVNWTEAGRPTDKRTIRKLLAKSVRGGTGSSILPSWVNNVMRALQTEDPHAIVLSGPKVQSFTRNLWGHYNEVTNDIWMANFALVDQAVFGGNLQGEGLDPGKGPAYLAMNAKIRRVAKTLTRETGRPWTAAHVQETVWSWAKTLYELADAEGTTPSRVLREGGLTDAAIAQAPDFEQLFVNDAPVREILEAAGYGDVLKAFERRAARAARGRDGETGRGRGGAGGRVTPGLLRSAKRLDEVQRRRQAQSLARRQERDAERRAQAKAARIADRQRRSARRDGEFYQAVEPPPSSTPQGFFSRISRAVEEAPFDRGTGAQWKGTIRNSKRGINLEEFRLVGLDALDDATQYTRAVVLSFLADHQVQVHTLELGAPHAQARLESRTQQEFDALLANRIEYLEENGKGRVTLSEGDFEIVGDDDEGFQARWHDDGELFGAAWDTEDEARTAALAEVDQINTSQEANFRAQAASDIDWSEAEQLAREALDEENEGREARYSAYVMPGADDGSYREIFLTSPSSAVESSQERLAILENNRDSWLAAAADEGNQRTVNERALSATMAGLYDKLIFAEDFLPGPGDAGFQTLSITENTALRYQNPWVFAALRAPQTKWGDGHDEYGGIDNPIVRVRYNSHTSVDGTKTLFIEEIQPPQEDQFKRMPALFQKTWRELGMKWALHHAAANGYHRLAWTSGAMQAKRYDLRRVASEIVYYAGTRQLAAFDEDGGELVRRHDVAPEQLKRYIGQDGARRLLAQKPEIGANVRSTVQFELGLRVSATQYSQDDEDRVGFMVVDSDGSSTTVGGLGQIFDTEAEARTALNAYLDSVVLERRDAGVAFARGSAVRYVLRGEGLEFGGEGLKRLYDVDLGNVVNKLAAVKRAGEKVVPSTPVPFGKNEIPMPASLARATWNVPPGDARAAADAAAAEWRRKNPAHDLNRHVPAIAITPKLREALLGGQELFQPDEPTGGLRGGYRPSDGRIRLIAGAENLSTFLHESGHAFLDELTLDALEVLAVPEGERTTLQQGVLRDAQTALNQMGFVGSIAEFRALPVDAKRDTHEQWARTFEAYLMTGKAPSPELRELFAKFRAWLVAVYKVIRRFGRVDRDTAGQALGVTLNEEIVGVMDRLLASDEAIAAVRAESQVDALFTDPASAGVDPLTFAAYQTQIAEANRAARESLDRRLLEDWRREHQAWWQREREKVVDDVQAQADANPVFIAQSVIRTGKMPDGSIPSFGDGRPLKLSKRAIIDLKGAAFPKQLPRPYLYSVDGGLHPDVVAELLGFSSGDALLESLLQAKPMRPIVNAEADRQMREKHGDVLLDGIELQDLAEQAVHEHRAEVIAAELKALTQGMVGSTIPSHAALRAAAAARIAQTKVRDLKPGLFLQAAQRASRQAFDAFAKNDRAGAVRAKQQELASLALFRAAGDAKDRALKSARLLQSFQQSLGRRKQLLHAGQDYLDQVDALLERYEFTKRTQKQIERRQSLRQWLATQEQRGLPVTVPDWLIDDARQINYTQLSVDELEGVRASVEQIAHVARLKDKLLKAQDQRTLNEIIDEIAGSIRAHHPTRPREIEPRLASERLKTFVAGVGMSHRKIASIARELDGFEDGGPMFDHVIRQVNDAGNHEVTMMAAAADNVRGLFRTHYSAGELAQMAVKRAAPALRTDTDPNPSLSKQALLMLALNQGNEVNRQRLRDGYGWSQDQVQAALDVLDKRDWEFVQGVWDYIDTYWPAIVEKQQRVIGAPPEKVLATPVFTRHGEFKGGYFPIKFEAELSGKVMNLEAANAADMQKAAAYVHSTTARGHLERRVEGPVKEHPVRLDFGVIFEHLGQVVHDLTHHEMLIDVGRILGSKEVESSIRETLGVRAFDQFRTALKDIAIGDVPARHETESLLGYVRNGATVAGLGWNFTTSLLQFVGLTQSVKRVGPIWVARGLTSFWRGAVTMDGTTKAVLEESELMKNRHRTLSPELNDVRRQLGIDTGKFSNWLDAALRAVPGDKLTKQGVADSFLWMITRAQLMVDVPTYLGAKAKAMADPANKKADGTIDEARVIAIAEQAVLDSQGGGQIKDLAAVQRGGPAWKIWINFYSFFNTTFNQWAESVRQHGGRVGIPKNPIAVGRMAADFMLLFSLPTVMSHVVRGLVQGTLDDELEDPAALAQDLALEQLAYMAGTMVFVRELGGVLQGYTTYEGPAGARGIATVSKLVKQASQLEADEAFWRALNQTGGVLFHYPAGQVDRTVRGIAALMDGRTGNPAAVIFGPPAKQ